jgi:anti-anti-sigma factor
VARLNVDVATLDGKNVLRLSGELDVSTSKLLHEKAGFVHGPILVDCDKLRFVDSVGFAALVSLRDLADSVVLWRPVPEIREVLHIMNLGGAVSIIEGSQASFVERSRDHEPHSARRPSSARLLSGRWYSMALTE